MSTTTTDRHEYSVQLEDVQGPDAPVAEAAELEDPAPPPAAAAPEAPVYYRNADPTRRLAPQAFLPVEKAGGMYVARLAEPLLVQTPPLTLASPLGADDDGYAPSHAHLALPRAFEQFARGVEALVLEAALANKAEWFRRAIGDDVLRARFKEFCRTRHLKVKLAPGFVAFDAAGQPVALDTLEAGGSLRCVLQLTRVCFGRTEFGAAWSLVQAQTAPPPPPPPRCLIDPSVEQEDDDPPGPPHQADAELHEFL
jgi:hypothetical protein